MPWNIFVTALLQFKPTLQERQHVFCYLITSACLAAVSPHLPLSPGPDNTRASLAAVGSWSMQVALLSLPDLKPIVTEDLGSEVIPRSVALAEFEGQAYVLCGLGDGQLHNWRWEPDSNSLSGKRRGYICLL